jgi:hypothetical protein
MGFLRAFKTKKNSVDTKGIDNYNHVFPSTSTRQSTVIIARTTISNYSISWIQNKSCLYLSKSRMHTRYLYVKACVYVCTYSASNPSIVFSCSITVTVWKDLYCYIVRTDSSMHHIKYSLSAERARSAIFSPLTETVPVEFMSTGKNIKHVVSLNRLEANCTFLAFRRFPLRFVTVTVVAPSDAEHAGLSFLCDPKYNRVAFLLFTSPV